MAEVLQVTTPEAAARMWWGAPATLPRLTLPTCGVERMNMLKSGAAEDSPLRGPSIAPE